MIGKVEKYLLDRIRQYDAIHISLIDPEKVTPQSASKIAREVESCKTAAIMVGGSTLFPNNITGICKYADAIWFMSLLNSSDPYFITGAQVLGAPIIKKFGLEVIPLGYIIVGENSAASVVGRACPIPYTKPELAVAHALAAQYFGMRFVYLEAGSGAKRPPANDMIKMVKGSIHIPLIVGGGMRTGGQVKEAVDAGADVIVTGTVIEEGGGVDKIRELVEYIKTDRRARDDRF
jgi:phosphoglycerol geranylgeranyltransferase